MTSQASHCKARQPVLPIWEDRSLASSFFAINPDFVAFAKMVGTGLQELRKRGEPLVLLPHIQADPDALCTAFALSELCSLMGVDHWIGVSEPIQGPICRFLQAERGEGVLDRVRILENPEALEAFTRTLGPYVAFQVDAHAGFRLGDRAALRNQASSIWILDHHCIDPEDEGELAKIKAQTGSGVYVQSDRSSCAELAAALIYLILEDHGYDPLAVWRERLTLINALLAGIYSDSGSLMYPAADPWTYTCSTFLIGAGAEKELINAKLFKEIPYTAFEARAQAFLKTQILADGQIAFMVIEPEWIASGVLQSPDFAVLVARMRNIQGVRIGALLKVLSPDWTQFKISLRSGPQDSILEIARAFGGGGHRQAAAASFTLPPMAGPGKALQEIQGRLIKLAQPVLRAEANQADA